MRIERVGVIRLQPWAPNAVRDTGAPKYLGYMWIVNQNVQVEDRGAVRGRRLAEAIINAARNFKLEAWKIQRVGIPDLAAPPRAMRNRESSLAVYRNLLCLVAAIG